MTLLYYDQAFLEHDTGPHPECAERLRHIESRLEACGLLEDCQRPSWESITDERIARVHKLAYAEQLRQFAAAGGGRFEQDTVLCSRSFEIARRAAGAVSDATVRVVGGEDRHALCLVRPPGHHALRAGAMGFCLLNHIAIAARVATSELALDRVLVVDWDVHHGNGTQDAFWSDQQVGFFSIHRWPFYPGTGGDDETGTGAALGTTMNLPVLFGTPRADYLKRFSAELETFAARLKPQLLLVSAGFDSHRADPIGSLGLEVEDFVSLTETVIETANTHCQGRVVSVLEGGYNPPVLAECIEAHLRTLGRTSHS